MYAFTSKYYQRSLTNLGILFIDDFLHIPYTMALYNNYTSVIIYPNLSFITDGQNLKYNFLLCFVI